MARLFNDAINDEAHIDQAVVSGVPFAVSIWFRRDADVECVPFSLVDKDTGVVGFLMQLLVSGESNLARVLVNDGSYGIATTSTGTTDNVWQHVCALFVSSTDRRILLNAGGKGTNATSITPANMDRTTIGYWGTSSPSNYFSGDIAEVAIWDLSVWPGGTNSDKADNFEKILASIVAGYSAQCFPLGLKAYWPLIRELNDRFGGYNLTASGTTASSHPRIIQPNTQVLIPITVATDTLKGFADIITSTEVIAVKESTLATDAAIEFITGLVASKEQALSCSASIQVNTETDAKKESTLVALADIIISTDINIDIFRYLSIAANAAIELSTGVSNIIVEANLSPSAEIILITDVDASKLALTGGSADVVISTNIDIHKELITGGSADIILSTTAEIWRWLTEMPPLMHSLLIDPYQGGAWMWLFDISIPGYTTVYLARNTENVTYAENTYTTDNIDVGLAGLVADDSVPRTIVKVAKHPDYRLENKINATQGGGGGTIKIIRVHEDFLVDHIIELEDTVRILTAGSDTNNIVFQLGIPDPLQKKIPVLRSSSKICPYHVPGKFKGIECQYAGGDPTCTGKYTDCLSKSNTTHYGAMLGLDPNTTRV